MTMKLEYTVAPPYADENNEENKCITFKSLNEKTKCHFYCIHFYQDDLGKVIDGLEEAFGYEAIISALRPYELANAIIKMYDNPHSFSIVDDAARKKMMDEEAEKFLEQLKMNQPSQSDSGEQTASKKEETWRDRPSLL